MATHIENERIFRNLRERMNVTHHLTDVDDFWDALPTRTKKHLLDNGARLEYDRSARTTITVNCEPNCSFCNSVESSFRGRYGTGINFVSLTNSGRGARRDEIVSNVIYDSEDNWHIDLKTIGLAALVLMALARFSSVTADASAGRSIETSTFTPVSIKAYQVVPGDTLSAIAQRLGVPTEVLAQTNNISDANLIQAGQVLSIP